MSQLVECVPNFSEGKNQEVRHLGRWGAVQGAQGKENAAQCGVWGLSSLERVRKGAAGGQAGPGPGLGLGSGRVTWPLV